MQTLECRPRHLRLFGPTNRLRNFEEQLLGADVIFVPGGNTLNMLGVWRAQGVDLLLRKAWEQGTVLAGESAGMICWFEQGVTDSRPGALGSMPCLGWLPGSACPHYNNPQRRPAYHALMGRGEIRAGLACEDGAGVLFEDTRLEGAYALSDKPAAFRVHAAGGTVTEERLPARVLPRPS
jgi:dipeptidase E